MTNFLTHPYIASGKIPFVFDDGGAGAAGYAPDQGDCVPRAIAIATGQDYKTVLAGLRGLAGPRYHPRSGVKRAVYEKYLFSLGWVWLPTMHIGSGCTVHLRAEELPTDMPIIARLSKHVCAVVDGVVRDTFDPSRGGTRCVYGMFQPGANGVIR